MAISYSLPLAAAVWVIILYCTASCTASYFRSSHVNVIRSCSFAGPSNVTVTDSEAKCKFACLARQDVGGCAAYQWDAFTRECHTQEDVVVNASTSTEDAVGVMVGCTSDDECPPGYACSESPCVQLESSCVSVPVDCAAILAAHPSSPSGVYRIQTGSQHVQQVWCDMDTDGGGWTVFLKRLDGSVDFYQDEATYIQGFGDVTGEYWLGLDALRAMTSSRIYELRADVTDWQGASVHSQYASILVGAQTDNFRLTLGAFTFGTDGDGLSAFQNMKFTTKDAKRDNRPEYNCAQRHGGGFWYNRCFTVNPTGRYYDGGSYTNSKNDGIQWRSWSRHKDKWYSMKTVQLKIR